jgi:hypothetical protein
MMLSTHRREAKTPSWPLCAFALAYARRLGSGRVSAETRWVEKSPASERFLSRIWHDFPAAKVIHIVREPGAVLRSYAALNSHHWGARRAATHCLLNMAPSYKIARRGPLQFQPDRYLLVRYEDLVADRESAMMRVAEFLGIVPLATLREPTVAGRPALNNTSFAEGTPRPITRLERTLLTLAVARNARGIGYR